MPLRTSANGRAASSRLAALAMVGFGIMVWFANADAVEIRVRARAQLAAQVQAEGADFSVRFVLSDDTQQPIARAEIAFEAPNGLAVAAGTRAVTDEQGQARWLIERSQASRWAEELGRTTLLVGGRFEGDSRFSSIAASARLDLQRAPVQLQLQALPAEIDVGTPVVSVRVEASGEAPAADLGLRVALLAPASVPSLLGADSPPDPVISSIVLRTDMRGLAAGELAVPADISPGRHSLIAKTDGNAAYAAAESRISLLVVQPTQLSLRAVGEAVPGAEFHLEGELLAGQRGLEGQPIALLASGVTVAATSTQADGSFRFAISAERLSALSGKVKTLEARAVFETTLAGWLPSVSAPLRLLVGAGESLPRLPYAITFALVALFTMLGWAWRAGALRGFLRSLPWKFGRATSPQSPASTLGAATVEVSGTDSTACNLSGFVYDALTTRPVGGVFVCLRSHWGDEFARTGANGRFQFMAYGRNPDGNTESNTEGIPTMERLALSATAPGYRAIESHPLNPDALRGAVLKLRLTPLRQEARDRFIAAVSRLWPSGFPWGRMSPAQARLRLLQEPKANLALIANAVDAFERAYFGKGPLTPEELDLLTTLLAAVERDMGSRYTADTSTREAK